jgi:hypothetical protein
LRDNHPSSNDDWLVEPQVVPHRFNLREPIKLAASFARPLDDPRAASLQVKAEIGPHQDLKAPLGIADELMDWIDVYRRLIQVFLPGEVHITDTGYKIDKYPSLPLRNDYDNTPDLLEPYSFEIFDPRPVLVHDDGTFNGINRRLVYHAVNFDVDQNVSDRHVIKSALVAMTRQLQSHLRNWYKDLLIPLRSTMTAQQFRNIVDEQQRRLGL